MIVGHVDQRTVRSALELASRAPSVHNSQPWRWRLGPTSIHLYADLRRWLPATDAEGRDLIVSCGAVLHHLRVALGAAGISTSVHRMPNPGQPDHLAAVELRHGAPTDAEVDLAGAITRRRTDRRRFGNWEVPDGFLQELVTRAAEQGALLRPVTGGRARSVLIDAIREAAETQETSSAYWTETALWSGRHADIEGVPAANLLRDVGADTARRFSEGLIEETDTGEPDGAVLLVLGTASDDPLSQLRAGEALSAVLLYATEVGLATCPLSQPLEVGTSRLVLQDDVLDGAVCPQLVLRLGWPPVGPPLPPTPRRPIDDMIEPLPL